MELPAEVARGYVMENYGHVLTLPELGPIGAKGLANHRDFLAPVAAFEDNDRTVEVVQKYGGRLWAARVVRRQGGGLRARRGQPAQLVHLARPGRHHLPPGEHSVWRDIPRNFTG